MTAKRVQRLLYASAFVRAMATSTAGVTLGGFLGKLDAGGLELGIVVSARLAGRLPQARRHGSHARPHLILWRAFRGIKPPEERT